MNDTRPIGIFDSGVGGLTVVKAMTDVLPDENIIYLGDTSRGPYAALSPEEVEGAALWCIFFLMERNAKLVVTTSHTVCSVVFERLSQKFHMPMIGVLIPGVQSALRVTRNACVGVIGSEAVVSSAVYERELKKQREDVSVVSHACPLHDPSAGEDTEKETARRLVTVYEKSMRGAGVDTLILASSSFLPITTTVQEGLKDVTVIDTAAETAEVVSKRLRIVGMKNTGTDKPQHEFFFSSITPRLQSTGECILGRPMESVKPVDLASKSIHTWMPECGNPDGIL
jgi:glutamate racemase